MPRRLRDYICQFCNQSFSSKQACPIFCSYSCAKRFRDQEDRESPNNLRNTQRRERFSKYGTKEYFLSKVSIPENIDECWTWTEYIDKKGYGRFYIKGKTIRAHRASYFIFRGNILEHLHVLHKCGNPSCVNPKHLELGTNMDNIRDKIAFGNHIYGEKSIHAKLTESQITEMRKIRESTNKIYRVIAREYGISTTNAVNICKRIKWKHVE